MTLARRRVLVIDGSVAMTGAFVSARDMARALRKDTDVVLVLPEAAKIAEAELTDFDAVHRLPLHHYQSDLRTYCQISCQTKKGTLRASHTKVWD